MSSVFSNPGSLVCASIPAAFPSKAWGNTSEGGGRKHEAVKSEEREDKHRAGKSEGWEDKHRAVKSEGGGNTSISDLCSLCTLINETQEKVRGGKTNIGQ